MSDETNRLRAEVSRLRRAVTRKVSRLKQRHDVYLSGTGFDPRRPANIEGRYTDAQLRSYMHDLAGFVDRGNQFVGDAQNRPIPRSDWQRYKALEAQYNRQVHQKFDRFSRVELPTPALSGERETIGERMARVTPDHRQMGNPAVNAPYDPVVREPRNVGSRAAVEKLIQAMNKRLEPGWFEEQERKGMQQFGLMMDVVNDKELSEEVKGLTSEQFAILWNYTSFATDVSIPYEFALKDLSGPKRAFQTDLPETSLRHAHDLVKWAKTVSLGG